MSATPRVTKPPKATINRSRMKHDPALYEEAIRLHRRYGFGARIIAVMLVVDHGVSVPPTAVDVWLKSYRRGEAA